MDDPVRARNDDTGRFVDKYPPERFAAAIAEHGGAAGTAEIAEEVGCIRETAYKRLKRMEADDRVDSRKVGGALLWTLAEAEDAAESVSDSGTEAPGA